MARKPKYTDAEARAIVIAAVGEGVEFLEPYPGTTKKWRLRCPNGHEWSPALYRILNEHTKGCGRCKRMGDDEARAFVLVKFPGTKFLESYPGADTPWKMRCSKGHACSPRFAAIKNRDGGLCLECAGNKEITAEQAIAEILTLFPDAQVVGEYRGNDEPLDMICLEGHSCSPRPRAIRKMGQGICRKCRNVGNSRRLTLSDDAARERVISRFPGTQILEPYPGRNDLPWSMVCANGHENSPTLSDLTGNRYSVCSECAREHLATLYRLSDEEARAKVLAIHRGVTFLEPYPGKNNLPWAMLCPKGHRCSPTLSHAQRPGRGVCSDCAVYGLKASLPTVLYDLRGEVGGRTVTQYGIANNKSLESRLAKHRRTGFVEEPRVLIQFDTGTSARAFESAVTTFLRENDISSCTDDGVVFDGSTESFFTDNLTPIFLRRYEQFVDSAGR